MTEHQRKVARALSICTLTSRSLEDRADQLRFLGQMAVAEQQGTRLTKSDADHLDAMAWRYRKQMPKELLPPWPPL